MEKADLKYRERAGQWNGVASRLHELYVESVDEDFRTLLNWAIHDGNSAANKLNWPDQEKKDYRRWAGQLQLFLILGEYILGKET